MGGVVSGEEGDRSDVDAVFTYKLLPQNKMKKKSWVAQPLLKGLIIKVSLIGSSRKASLHVIFIIIPGKKRSATSTLQKTEL